MTINKDVNVSVPSIKFCSNSWGMKDKIRNDLHVWA